MWNNRTKLSKVGDRPEAIKRRTFGRLRFDIPQVRYSEGSIFRRCQSFNPVIFVIPSIIVNLSWVGYLLTSRVSLLSFTPYHQLWNCMLTLKVGGIVASAWASSSNAWQPVTVLTFCRGRSMSIPWLMNLSELLYTTPLFLILELENSQCIDSVNWYGCILPMHEGPKCGIKDLFVAELHNYRQQTM